MHSTPLTISLHWKLVKLKTVQLTLIIDPNKTPDSEQLCAPHVRTRSQVVALSILGHGAESAAKRVSSHNYLPRARKKTSLPRICRHG